MNRAPDVELVLNGWLADDGDIAPDRVLEVVADRIAMQPQRRNWRLPGRLTLTPAFKYGIAAAAVLVVAVAGYSLLPKGPSVGTQSPVPPTLAPTPSPSEMVLSDGPLTAGRYRVRPYADAPKLSFTADIPGGWEGVLGVAMFGPHGYDGPRGVAVALLRTDGLFSDPCHWDLDGSGSSDQPGDLAVGPGANLANALAGNPSYESDGTVISGFPAHPDSEAGEVAGLKVTIHIPASVDMDACDKDSDGEGRYYVFSGPDAGFYAKGNGNIWDIHIVTVHEVRLIIVVSYFEDTPASDLAAANAIVGSFDFVP
jgi:hypothetical protein